MYNFIIHRVAEQHVAGILRRFKGPGICWTVTPDSQATCDGSTSIMTIVVEYDADVADRIEAPAELKQGNSSAEPTKPVPQEPLLHFGQLVSDYVKLISGDWLKNAKTLVEFEPDRETLCKEQTTIRQFVEVGFLDSRTNVDMEETRLAARDFLNLYFFDSELCDSNRMTMLMGKYLRDFKRFLVVISEVTRQHFLRGRVQPSADTIPVGLLHMMCAVNKADADRNAIYANTKAYIERKAQDAGVLFDIFLSQPVQAEEKKE